jgi:antitoxin (DNA-binding transcriptional repressor) of toxin-antitoxin stability system
MLAKQVDVQKTSLKELLALVREGTEVLLTEDDTPIAKIVPVEQKQALIRPRVPGLFPGIWMSEDFDDPLPDEFWFGEE